MTTATIAMEWFGRSGRRYIPAGRHRARHGNRTAVRKVVGSGEAVGTSVAAEGAPLALKSWREGDELSLDLLQQEARTLVEIASVGAERGAELPCPRLYDLVGDPLVTGVVMEWCPLDLEQWWRDKLREPDAFGRLCAALAEAARRVSEYQRDFAGKRGLDVAHGDMKPTNVMMNAEGRWVVSDFGTAPIRPHVDDVWAESRVVVAADNFIAPEVLFSARRTYPAAVDTWSIGASFFALLKLRRMVLDGSPLPTVGTRSPRFRTERAARIVEVYGRDPQRFVDRDLDADAFRDPLRVPDEDRATVRDALRGVFHRDDAVTAPAATEAAERELEERVLELLDRALSIDPAHRFTDARDLTAAFEGLTRTYLALAAQVSASSPPAPPAPDALADALAAERQNARELRARLAQLEVALAKAPPEPAVAAVAAPPAARTPWAVTALLLVQVGLQVVTLLLVAAWVGLALLGAPLG